MISLLNNDKLILNALDRSLAIIQFDVEGRVLEANENFCRVMGYAAVEIVGKHHSVFVEPGYALSSEYKSFWTDLRRGDSLGGEYKRFGKGGKEVWIQASYNPVVNRSGKVIRVVKVATDVTAQKLIAAENEGNMAAVSRVQAIIEFAKDGTVLSANDNFLKTLGYSLNEIKGRHHRMFVDSAYASSPDYEQFWQRLNRGEVIAEEFRRVGKGGRDVWIQASYNPILDADGRVRKIVKFATDVSDRVKAVKLLGDGLSQLANGDLTFRIETAFHPSLDLLRVDFNQSVSGLQAAMSRITGNSTAILSGSDEVAHATDDLSKRTEQQAANLEETAAALEQITATVKKTAEGTRHARGIVESTKQTAEKSGEVVRQAVAAMTEIEKSSTQITQIISVIDEIAFQTNLLALNAGVEAARAGDAGRGFAVVASEVRALAQRSAEAAKEIKSLIATSTGHVNSGVHLVSQTGKSLGEIVDEVKQVAAVVIEIAASAQEQATGLEEVNVAISQMDQLTQQNAAMVEETTAASQTLNGEAKALQAELVKFTLGAAPSRARESRPQPKPAVRTVAPPRRSEGSAARKIQAVPEAESWSEF